MSWELLLHDDFEAEMQEFTPALQIELLAQAQFLCKRGPTLGRPLVDTLKNSRHKNMKELRFNWRDEVWRVAFAFDPKRKIILLVGGNKVGEDQKLFYKRLISIADRRFDQHLAEQDLVIKEFRHGKKS